MTTSVGRVERVLEASRDLPQRALDPGEVLIREGEPQVALYVLESGTFEVSRQGALVSVMSEPGLVIGEVAALLSETHGATVTATSPCTVRVATDVHRFLVSDPERLMEIATMLATRLNRLTTYLVDVRAQYASAGGHMELLDEVLTELTFGSEPKAEPGSLRDPDPLY